MWKKTVTAVLLVLITIFTVRFVLADDTCPVCSSEANCNERISCLRNQTKSLASQIELVDTQISVTKAQIRATQIKIDQLTNDIASVSGKIDRISESLEQVSKVLANRIVQTYITGRTDPMEYLLLSANFNDFVQRLDYLRIAQKHDKNLLLQMATTKKNYNDQKDLLEERKKQREAENLQLQTYKNQLDRQNREKQALLATTQQQLDQAIAQLAAFQSFVLSQGGASLLSPQTKCDDWGCYYNQRDSTWGAMALNHTGYTLADSGCLVTSMAMVATHYGKRSVTPVTINSISDNFAVYFPAYLKMDISADGSGFTRSRLGYSYSQTSSQIDSELGAGHPVVIGIGSGPAHFVVLVSGSGGNYLMNDPFVENGSKISFTSRYSLSSISEVDKVVQ